MKNSHSRDNNEGATITVMMARRSGKNRFSAILEAFLLFSRREGTIIKAEPKIVNSRRGLVQTLESSLFCCSTAPKEIFQMVTTGAGCSVERFLFCAEWFSL